MEFPELMKPYKKIFESVESDIEEIENIFIDFVDDEKFKVIKVNNNEYYKGQKIESLAGQDMKYVIRIGELFGSDLKSLIKSFNDFSKVTNMIEKLKTSFKRLEYKGFTMEVLRIDPDSANILVTCPGNVSLGNLNDYVKYFTEFDQYRVGKKEIANNAKQAFNKYLETLGCQHIHIPSKMPPYKFTVSQNPQIKIEYERNKDKDFIYEYDFWCPKNSWPHTPDEHYPTNTHRLIDSKYFFEIYLDGDQTKNTKLLNEIKKVDPETYKFLANKWTKQFISGEIYNMKLVEAVSHGHKGRLLTKVLIFLGQLRRPAISRSQMPVNTFPVDDALNLWRQTN